MDMTRFIITAVYKNNINVIEGLFPLSTELRHIGNNLNQLTRLCHGGCYIDHGDFSPLANLIHLTNQNVSSDVSVGWLVLSK